MSSGERHVCSVHGVALEERPAEHQSPEQRWCGTWYDCPRICGESVLEQSPELTAQLSEQSQARLGL